ncbi:hypothetical protein AAFJ72_07105 [Brevibacillus gelatini]|uniref:hypothetical protein n=1 Tax=Brevibacillus gelatini TaxID=1655277 RepID=UPI003D81B10F
MYNFKFKIDEKGRGFCNDIVNVMVDNFQITKEEAVGRINEHWSNTEIVGEYCMVYHELPEFWGYEIYFGSNSRWWARKDDPELKPKPFSL